MQLQRTNAAKRRKNHTTGIRSDMPLKLLHADVTIFRCADTTKAYIYLVQDNFSRYILSHTVATSCNASVMKELLKNVYDEYLQSANQSACELMTDGGNENFGATKEFLSETHNPSLKHIVAQQDVVFSNSMIEAANKNIKYRFLYHKHIADFDDLCTYTRQAIEDYNNRPHDALQGLTPTEVLNGMQADKNQLRQQIAYAQKLRIQQNKREICCTYSF